MEHDPREKVTFLLTVSSVSARQLEQLARKAGVAPEELLRSSIEEWLARPMTDFAEAAAHVLEKNTELYRRLT
jgi:hypothetical protein